MNKYQECYSMAPKQNSLRNSGIPAVVCTLRFDTTALGTFVDHFSWFQLQIIHVFFSGISFGHSPLKSFQLKERKLLKWHESI